MTDLKDKDLKDGNIKSNDTVKPEPKLDPNLQEALMRSLLRRESRLAEEEIVQENASIARQKQRMVNSKNHADKRFQKQLNCKHIKGGKKGPKAQVRDYAVYIHTFINRDQVIRCFNCGMKWKQGDTKEYLARDGRKIKNHTKLGWQEAVEMLAQSTNTPSSSEIPYTVTPIDLPTEDDIFEAAEVQ